MVKDLPILNHGNFHNLENRIEKQKTVLSAVDDHEHLNLL